MFKSIFGFFGRTVTSDEMIGDWLLNDRFQTFLDDPTLENYLKLRTLVLDDRTYSASAAEYNDVKMLMECGRFNDARVWLRRLGPGRLLSPKAHELAAIVGRYLGDNEGARRESLTYHRCIEGILGTGDGTREHPYLLTHAGDQFDLLDYLERKIGRQSVVQDQGRTLEHVECQDGSELWFDLSDVHARLDAPPRLSKPKRGSRGGR